MIDCFELSPAEERQNKATVIVVVSLRTSHSSILTLIFDGYPHHHHHHCDHKESSSSSSLIGSSNRSIDLFCWGGRSMEQKIVASMKNKRVWQKITLHHMSYWRKYQKLPTVRSSSSRSRNSNRNRRKTFDFKLLRGRIVPTDSSGVGYHRILISIISYR